MATRKQEQQSLALDRDDELRSKILDDVDAVRSMAREVRIRALLDPSAQPDPKPKKPDAEVTGSGVLDTVDRIERALERCEQPAALRLELLAEQKTRDTVSRTIQRRELEQFDNGTLYTLRRAALSRVADIDLVIALRMRGGA